jgi:nuclear transcription factor Y gamma
VDAAEQETPDYRHPPLPLARIKKVMKSDPDVKVYPSWFIMRGVVLADLVRRWSQRTHPSYFAKHVKVGLMVPSAPQELNVSHSLPYLLYASHQVFISEITARAFIIADSNKRRTLSRADIAKALAKSDQFDFLIDIVPREEGLTGLTHGGTGAVAGGSGSMTNLVAGVRAIDAACRTSQLTSL